MARRFSSPRPPKKYVWVPTTILGSFNTTTVAENDLVIASDFTQGALTGAMAHALNIIRVVGDVVITAVDANNLTNITDTFIAGPSCWGIFIRDENATIPIDPESAAGYSDEPGLGVGITETIGLIIDTAAFVAGTGLGVAFGSVLPYSVRVHFDIRTNRRLSNDQVLSLNLTRASNAQISINGGVDYIYQTNIRTLIKLP